MNYSTTNTANPSSAVIDAGLRDHMNQVYREMSYALGITGLIAYVFGQDLKSISEGATTLLPEALLNTLYQSPLIWAIMLAPLIMIFFTGKMMRSATASGTRSFLYVFAGLFGLSLATIFTRYADVMIAQAFFATAGAFAGLSLWGYTTKKDISGWGSFLFIGLIGLIIASIVNIFMGSGALQFAISLIGVLIFAGFTAYDTQKLKTNYLEMRNQMSEEDLAKMGTMGALTLFLDFVLLFQHLLSLFGMTSKE